MAERYQTRLRPSSGEFIDLNPETQVGIWDSIDKCWVDPSRESFRLLPVAEQLDMAFQRYWSAKSAREEQAAYHEILLFGGKDSYSLDGWRTALARLLRRAACFIEKI
jgi:hypothetical protein